MDTVRKFHIDFFKQCDDGAIDHVNGASMDKGWFHRILIVDCDGFKIRDLPACGPFKTKREAERNARRFDLTKAPL
jgi:hypothetical protein